MKDINDMNKVVLSGQSVLNDIDMEHLYFSSIDNESGFISYRNEIEASSELLKLGTIPDFMGFSSCYRNNACWMIPKIGSALNDIADETQFLLIRLRNDKKIMIIPLIGEEHRCCLFGKDNKLHMRIETGDNDTKIKEGICAYVSIGSNIYEMIENAVCDIQKKLKSFELRKHKKTPSFMKYYGWCTYNAFYADVSHEKILKVLAEYSYKGITPGFMILDVGWQSEKDSQMISFAADENKFPNKLKNTINEVKKNYGIKEFMIWHTFYGYWLGINGEAFNKYGMYHTKMDIPKRVLSADNNDDPTGFEATANKSFYPKNLYQKSAGLPDNMLAFYDDFHEYLKSQGADGVKIDAMAWIEWFGQHKGGRIKMMKKMLEAAESSTDKFFNGNLLNCSSCSNDFIFQTQKGNIMRTSTDFFPKIPSSHAFHIFTNAHTSYWTGEIIQPDWDMFQSGHYSGDYHAAARSISGGPVYSTDEIGQEEPNIIKKLFVQDGVVLLCKSYARICADSIFVDPMKEKVPIKIFNINETGGIIGVFNCGSENDDDNRIVRGSISPSDIHDVHGDFFVVYGHKEKKIIFLEKNEKHDIALNELEYDLYTVIPVYNGFAPIGLVEKYNSGGALYNLKYDSNSSSVSFSLMDGGEFIAYSESKPLCVLVNNISHEFIYDQDFNKLKIQLSTNQILNIKINY